MSVQRRAFLKFFAGVGLALAATWRPLSGSFWADLKKLPRIQRRAERKLSVGEVYVARPGGIARLPENPAVGDEVTLVVEAESLSVPAVIRYTGEKLGGLEEDLILDCLAICQLTYSGKELGWVNGQPSTQATNVIA